MLSLGKRYSTGFSSEFPKRTMDNVVKKLRRYPIMNKAELTAALVKKTGFTKKDAEKALGALTEVITEALAGGEKVQVVGFGSFEVRNRPARVARNPRTGEQIKIKASKAPVFKAGKALKDSVNK